MRICVVDHHAKAQYLASALVDRMDVVVAGYEQQADRWLCLFDNEIYPLRFDFEILLVDTEHPSAPPPPLKRKLNQDLPKRKLIKAAIARGIPVVLYPHGAMPDLDYDGTRKMSAPISLQLLHGEGHAEIYRRCGLGHRYEVVGWTYGPMAPSLGPYVEPKALLFAPIHPWANGVDILKPHRILNCQAYDEFVAHPAERKTVLMFGADAPNGVIERHDGIEYLPSGLSNVEAHMLITAHDAVISYGTFAYIALALGQRVAMIHSHPPHTDDEGKIPVAHFDDYADYVRYPATVGEAPLNELFQRDVSEWRRLFVGDELDVDKLEQLLLQLRPSRAVRRKLARV